MIWHANALSSVGLKTMAGGSKLLLSSLFNFWADKYIQKMISVPRPATGRVVLIMEVFLTLCGYD